jgi:hypothetical protein
MNKFLLKLRENGMDTLQLIIKVLGDCHEQYQLQKGVQKVYTDRL